MRIVYRSMESTPVLEEFAYKHLEKIKKLLENQNTPIVIDLILEPAPVHAHNKVTLIVKTPDYDLVANHEGPEMYQEIDLVTDKMIKEIRRAKERIVSERHTGIPKGTPEIPKGSAGIPEAQEGSEDDEE
ncbi:ribosome-associated translation inhibitor RaiA [Candidatus Dependentiae bacterium]|nr:ribosome-associated translation inhibitor RaiA [Candidatus Dependentiae bacterium]